MRTLVSGIALLLLAGCATTQPGTWVSDGRGGFCYRQGAACSYTGATPVASTSDKWWQGAAGVLGAVNQGMQSTGRGVYPAK